MSEATLERYREVKEQAEQLRRQADRAEGELDAKKSELKKEFGCSSLKEAKTLLDSLEEEESASKEKFEKALKEFEDEYADALA